MILVDSHCHLDDERYADETTTNVLARAAEADIHYVQTICTRRADFAKIHPMAMAHKNLFCSFGLHPHHADEETFTEDEILTACQQPKVIGIGETGLDYYYDNAPRQAQQASFRLHLEAARKLDMPVIIHTRDADDDTIAILDEALAKGPLRLLFHCFSASTRLAAYAVEKGIHMSASGIITFKNAEDVREGFRMCPLERILVETDAPYLAPVPHRGKRNEPAHTRLVAEELAKIKGVPLDALAEATTENFFRLFSKASR